MTAERRKSHTDELNAAYKRMSSIPTAMAVEDGTVADMPVLLRGNHLTPADLVARGVPRILAGSRAFSKPLRPLGSRPKSGSNLQVLSAFRPTTGSPLSKGAPAQEKPRHGVRRAGLLV